MKRWGKKIFSFAWTTSLGLADGLRTKINEIYSNRFRESVFVEITKNGRGQKEQEGQLIPEPSCFHKAPVRSQIKCTMRI